MKTNTVSDLQPGTRREFLRASAALAVGAYAAVPAIMHAEADSASDAVPRLPSSSTISKPPYLVFLPLSDGISPAKVFQDRAYIETLPIDGVVMEGRTIVAGVEKSLIAFGQIRNPSPMRRCLTKWLRSRGRSRNSIAVG